MYNSGASGCGGNCYSCSSGSAGAGSGYEMLSSKELADEMSGAVHFDGDSKDLAYEMAHGTDEKEDIKQAYATDGEKKEESGSKYFAGLKGVDEAGGYGIIKPGREDEDKKKDLGDLEKLTLQKDKPAGKVEPEDYDPTKMAQAWMPKEAAAAGISAEDFFKKSEAPEAKEEKTAGKADEKKDASAKSEPAEKPKTAQEQNVEKVKDVIKSIEDIIFGKK